MEATGELTDLSIAQLEELIEEQKDEHTRMVLTELLQRRRDLESLVQQQEAERPRRKRRGGIRTTSPKGRALDAAKSFSSDPDRVQVWQEAVQEATDDDGNVQLSGRIIQLAIGAYYAQRREEKRLNEAAQTTEQTEEVATSGQNQADEQAPVADLPEFQFEDDEFGDDWSPVA